MAVINDVGFVTKSHKRNRNMLFCVGIMYVVRTQELSMSVLYIKKNLPSVVSLYFENTFCQSREF